DEWQFIECSVCGRGSTPAWIAYVGFAWQRRWKTQGYGAYCAGGTLIQHAAYPGGAHHHRTYPLWYPGASYSQHPPCRYIRTLCPWIRSHRKPLRVLLASERSVILVMGDVR